ncbi:leucine--tRNA ligase [Saccharicrinis sp. FJH54]|uniref:leucine--tRNA ligase n=1 Tax=Saccharicrinis sp. FJH54 TaxID=3344665 RepID=UPI0035D46F82
MEYNFTELEKKWQAYWEKHKTFSTPDDYTKEKYYILDMFPYPSGAGLHVGHPEGYTATDIISRYKRMKGLNVLHPMGWDAFGLPAEQYAIQTGTHPSVTTKKNCDNFRRQIKSLGLSYDWDREINTTDPAYFKWTQWIFIQLYNTWFDDEQQKGRPVSELVIPEQVKSEGKEAVDAYISKKRLAYYDNAQVWYCNHCKTVCANEEVLNDGSHEKCGTKEVVRKNLKQWMLRIPHYAERLLQGLEQLDWPEGVKDMQRNWIGKSLGAEVDFQLEGLQSKLRVYTTRPDTLFGATYMVVAPEHELLDQITSEEQREEVGAYVKAAALKSDLDRTELAKEKTGVFTGRYAVNPVNGNRIPVWVADYVLMGYGTGAIMAVPAHDTRDFEFARKFDIPVVCILDPGETVSNRGEILNGDFCWTEDGEYINSANPENGLNINGLNKKDGIRTVTSWLESNGLGKGAVNYKLRDWLFSRQRYWGEPFPVIHWEDGEVSVLNTEELPLQLPEVEKYQPGDGGESPLSNAGEWLHVTDENGRKGRRETNTMPQWAGSCWYYLRYIDPKNDEAPFDKVKENYWMPVDLYVGGAEHAVLHLLYSRFWHKVLFDLGVVSTDEPFKKLYNQGMILAFAYETQAGSKVTSDLVEERDGKFYHTETGEELNQIVAKMSKSLKNVVNPDDVVQNYGADSLRLYEMFMGPLDATKPWSEQGVKGVFNFLGRVHRFFADTDNIREGEEDAEVLKGLHQTIKKVASDIENMKFNTAISQLMVFTNLVYKKKTVTKDTARTFALVLSPYAPHLAEELWQMYGGKESLAYESWPEVNEAYLVENTYEYPVSFNGKMRFTIEFPLDEDKEVMEKTVLEHEKAQKWTEGKQVLKVIIVPKKIINIVVR